MPPQGGVWSRSSFSFRSGGLAAAETALTYVVLALVLVNLVTRLLAHRSHVAQVARGETPSRHLPHVASSVVLLLASFAYLVAAPHGGMVLSVLVVATLLADLFEFESRQVEARNDFRSSVRRAR